MSESRWWLALEELKRIARERGCVRPRDIIEMDLSANWVRLFSWEFQKRARGVYFPSEVVPDRLVILLAKYPRLVVGLTTALWVHGILARRPKEDWIVHAVNCPEPVRYPRAVMVRTTWPHQHIEEAKLQGVTFRVQQPARAVVDCIRFRQRLGPRRVQWILREAFASGKVTVEEMRAIARATRLLKPVDRALRQLFASRRSLSAPGVRPGEPPSARSRISGVGHRTPAPIRAEADSTEAGLRAAVADSPTAASRTERSGEHPERGAQLTGCPAATEGAYADETVHDRREARDPEAFDSAGIE